jgi:hypothetical protein
MMDSAKPSFAPWIGSEYRSGFSSPRICEDGTGHFAPKRTLILGESYYNNKKDEYVFPRTFTNGIIQEQIEGKPTKAFYTRIVSTFLGVARPLTLEDKRLFWHSVGYYTFVQTPVGGTARVRPSPELWAQGQSPFLEILKELQPECIIVLGYELWRHLPLTTAGPVISGAKQEATFNYATVDSNHALAYGIEHPSSGRFSSKRWHEFVMRAIELAPKYRFEERSISQE